MQLSIGVTHLAASKAFMRWLGIDCGPVRLPLAQPSTVQLAALREKLETLGFFTFAAATPSTAPAVSLAI